RWGRLLEGDYSYLAQDYLSDKFQTQISAVNLFINPAFFPTETLLYSIMNLNDGEMIWSENQMIAGRLSFEDFEKRNHHHSENQFTAETIHIHRLWDLFSYNDYAIRFDCELITKGRNSQPISSTNGVINPQNIFLEEGASVEYAILNAKS